MNLKELVPPSSNNIPQEISQSRTVPPPTTTTTTASTSNETPSGITTTFFLSDDAESLNSDLTQTASLSPLTDCLPTTITTIPPTKARGNGNNHHSGVHSITKVKNIDLIHLGRYFIKPWYFSPYPEVKFIRKKNELIHLFMNLFRNLHHVQLFISVNFVLNIVKISMH
jgi:hypothetical protein